MTPRIRNIIAVVVGWLSGSILNMLLISVGHQVFPIEGVDLNNMDEIAEVMPTLGYKYFIFPFLAHALGTLIGAIIAFLIAETHKEKMSMTVGFLFFISGIIAAVMIPAPSWFIAVDLVFAYIPMAWIAGKLMSNK